MRLSLAVYQRDLGTPEAQPSTASRDELSAVWASESQHGCRGIKITSCPRLGTVATAKVQETFMARYTELTELLKPRAQCGQFLERYPQVKEQNLYTRSLLRSQAYRAARRCRASVRL